MGSCVSVHKDSDSAMKLRLAVGSKDENLLIPSPVKQKSDAVNGADHTVADLALKPQWSSSRFREAGSKDEAFFDSQPWIESDCEDDFLSVNGDFTPSHGSTPVHHKFSSGANKARDDEGTPSPPDNKKKRLSELFKESLRRDPNVDEENNAATDHNVVPEKARADANSGGNSERTTNGVHGAEDESVKAAQCCIPRLVSSRSFSERKLKKTSDG